MKSCITLIYAHVSLLGKAVTHDLSQACSAERPRAQKGWTPACRRAAGGEKAGQALHLSESVPTRGWLEGKGVPQLLPIIPGSDTQPLPAPRSSVCQSQGLDGGPLWSRPGTLGGGEPLPLTLGPSFGPGQPRPTDVLCQGPGSGFRETASWKGSCVRGKPAPNNSQTRA